MVTSFNIYDYPVCLPQKYLYFSAFVVFKFEVFLIIKKCHYCFLNLGDGEEVG